MADGLYLHNIYRVTVANSFFGINNGATAGSGAIHIDGGYDIGLSDNYTASLSTVSYPLVLSSSPSQVRCLGHVFDGAATYGIHAPAAVYDFHLGTYSNYCSSLTDNMSNIMSFLSPQYQLAPQIVTHVSGTNPLFAFLDGDNLATAPAKYIHALC